LVAKLRFFETRNLCNWAIKVRLFFDNDILIFGAATQDRLCPSLKRLRGSHDKAGIGLLRQQGWVKLTFGRKVQRFRNGAQLWASCHNSDLTRNGLFGKRQFREKVFNRARRIVRLAQQELRATRVFRGNLQNDDCRQKAGHKRAGCNDPPAIANNLGHTAKIECDIGATGLIIPVAFKLICQTLSQTYSLPVFWGVRLKCPNLSTFYRRR